MSHKELKDKILNIIPIIGVSLMVVILICLLFSIWGDGYEYPLKIAGTSFVFILVLIGIERSLK